MTDIELRHCAPAMRGAFHPGEAATAPTTKRRRQQGSDDPAAGRRHSDGEAAVSVNAASGPLHRQAAHGDRVNRQAGARVFSPVEAQKTAGQEPVR
jgi:hypothetical protein